MGLLTLIELILMLLLCSKTSILLKSKRTNYAVDWNKIWIRTTLPMRNWLENKIQVNLISTLNRLFITEVDTRDITSLSTMDLLLVKMVQRVKELIDLRFLPAIREDWLNLKILVIHKLKNFWVRVETKSLQQILSPSELKKNKTNNNS